MFEAVLEDWGILLREHLPNGSKETDEEKAPYEAYGEVLERVDNARPLELLEACSRALAEPGDRHEALALAYDVAKADGRVAPEQQEMFQTLVGVLGASKEDVQRARETVDELNAFEKTIEEIDLGDADEQRAPRLTSLEAIAGVAELATHADADADPEEHAVIEAFCEEHEIAIADFQDAGRKAQQAREAAGPLGLLSACGEALDGEELDNALGLARDVIAADDEVGPDEEKLVEILENSLS